jgi:uncharacterized protein YceH (UPF0502 family)
MARWRLDGLAEQIENAARGLRNLIMEELAVDSPTPSSEGEATEPSPLEVRLYNLEHQVQDLYSRLDKLSKRRAEDSLRLEVRLRTLEARVIALEAGLQSPPNTSQPGYCPTCGRSMPVSPDTERTREPMT